MSLEAGLENIMQRTSNDKWWVLIFNGVVLVITLWERQFHGLHAYLMPSTPIVHVNFLLLPLFLFLCVTIFHSVLHVATT